MRRVLFFFLMTLQAACPAPPLFADDPRELPLHDKTRIRFAARDEGRTLMARADRFIQAMSPFDRQCRLGVVDDASEARLLEFVADQTLDWDPDQIDRLTVCIESARRKLATLRVPLPERVLLIQTTGREEGGAAYCRSPAIILPRPVLRQSAESLERLLLHELFHIMSVHDATLRASLYRLIGFQQGEEIALPPELASRKLTNPDAPRVDSWIEVDVNGRRTPAAPLLIASASRFDPAVGGSLFRYMQFRLLVLERVDGALRPTLQDGAPVLVDPKKIPSYHEQIGKNTGYIIHPDEILADNFTYLVLGRKDLATPGLVESMRTLLARP